MHAKQPYIGYTLMDERGSSSRAKYSVTAGLSVVDMTTGADSLRSRLSSISGCVFVRQSAIFPYLEALPAPAAIGSNADSVALLIFTTNTPNEYASIAVPGIRPELILQTGPNAGLVLDIEAGPVVAFIDAITSGLYCNPFGYDIVELAATIVERRL